MKKRSIFLITVLAVMFGGTSAVGLADEHEETETPEANTVFVADISVEDETTYIKYHVCNLNAEDEDDAEACADVLGNDLPDFTDEEFWSSIEVEFDEDGANHGAYVSAFAQGLETDGPGKGCVMRYIAQSDWGKEGFDVEGEDVLIEAQTFCSFNRVSGEEDGGDGPPPWAGIGKKKWEAEQSSEATTAGGPPPWAGQQGGPNG